MERYIIRVSRIIAYDQPEVMENNGLLIENGKIQRIYDNISQIEIPGQTDVIDYGDKVIIPGMIDCHNHLALDARLESHPVKVGGREAGWTTRAIKTMKDDLVAGVTISRYLGDRFCTGVTCKKVQKERRVARPKLVINGIDVRSSREYGYVGIPHYGTEDLRKAFRENIAHGVDFSKVFMTEVISATPFIYHFLTLEELRVVVEEAKSMNITTTYHCSGEQGLGDCLTAGIDCLEHVYYITQPQTERVRKKNRWVVYTPSYALNDQLLFKLSPHDREGSPREKEIICKCLLGAIEGRLKFNIDTDRLHQGLVQEACCTSGLGVKDRDVLAGIAIDAVRICGADKSTGSIAEGKAADLVVLKGSPLDDIEALKEVTSAIQNRTVIF